MADQDMGWDTQEEHGIPKGGPKPEIEVNQRVQQNLPQGDGIPFVGKVVTTDKATFTHNGKLNIGVLAQAPKDASQTAANGGHANADKKSVYEGHDAAASARASDAFEPSGI